MAETPYRRDCVIAVDGPAGAGKSTVARAVAARLGYVYIDTGAMYRALTLSALRHDVACNDVPGLLRLLDSVEIRLVPQGAGEENRVFLGDEDVTAAIRQPEVNRKVSQVAAHAALRHKMVEMQRRLAEKGGVVMDGRDIGTVVLPNADVKVFLVADLNVRAQRRWEELTAKGHDVTLAQVRQELAERDERDTTRGEAPLRKAEDAVVIDTTKKSVEDVVEDILRLCRTGS